MCGRYALNTTATELINHFKLISCPEFGVRYNIAPTSTVPIIRHKPDAGRVGQLVRWGLIPSWAKDPSVGAKLNNARGETVAEKPSFRTSFARYRCLIPASGFYEWKTISEGGKVRKQPYYIHPADPAGMFAFAGLMAVWRSEKGEQIVSTCIITTEPNEVMLPIHDRMPVILSPEVFDSWLDPGNQDVASLKLLMAPCPAEGMSAYPVKPLRTDGAECLEPVG